MRAILMWGLVPPVLLMMYMYRIDKVDKEPVGLICKTFIFGMISVIPAIILELGLGFVLDMVYPGYTKGTVYNLIYFFLVVGFSEEFSKRLMATISVWKSPEFHRNSITTSTRLFITRLRLWVLRLSRTLCI